MPTSFSSLATFAKARSNCFLTAASDTSVSAVRTEELSDASASASASAFTSTSAEGAEISLFNPV